jgi:hypothetical protein
MLAGSNGFVAPGTFVMLNSSRCQIRGAVNCSIPTCAQPETHISAVENAAENRTTAGIFIKPILQKMAFWSSRISADYEANFAL